MKSLFKSKKRIILSVVAVVVVAFLLVNVGAAAFFSSALLKKDGWEKFEKYSYGEELRNSSEWISAKSEKAEIENADGEMLSALEIKNEHVSNSYIVICHQYGGSPYSMDEYAKHFYDLGFNVILPYMRGHGESTYNNISLGWEDGFDVADWIEYIIEKDKKSKIALFGVSLGANAVTLAASEELPENVRLVIADSCYTSIDELIKEYIKNEIPVSSLLTVNFTSAFSKNKIGETFKNADTIVKIRDIELPIIFINGENDTVVPPLLSKKLYENCEAQGVEEVIIENGTHGRNLEADSVDYWTNIDAFILNNLGI